MRVGEGVGGRSEGSTDGAIEGARFAPSTHNAITSRGCYIVLCDEASSFRNVITENGERVVAKLRGSGHGRAPSGAPRNYSRDCGYSLGRTFEQGKPYTVISPRIDKLLEHVDSDYASVVVAARRARQINSYYHNLGEGTFDEFPPPMVETRSKNYLTIALEEVAQGKLKYHYR
jgi:DNA-directed RNA polymerase subunit omega